MRSEFEISMMGELNYFLGKQFSEGIFINQAKYTRELIQKFGQQTYKVGKIPMNTSTRIDLDEEGY